jgi:hypothetical protein
LCCCGREDDEREGRNIGKRKKDEHESNLADRLLRERLESTGVVLDLGESLVGSNRTLSVQVDARDEGEEDKGDEVAFRDDGGDRAGGNGLDDGEDLLDIGIVGEERLHLLVDLVANTRRLRLDEPVRD